MADLLLACSRERRRLAQPFQLGEAVYATNGTILVSAPWAGEVVVPDEYLRDDVERLVGDARERLERVGGMSADGAALTDWAGPMTVPCAGSRSGTPCQGRCRPCNGAGIVRRACEHCGEGHEECCAACKGRGWDCTACKGTGIDQQLQPGILHGATVDRRLLAIGLRAIGPVGAVQIATGDPFDPVFVVGADRLMLVMPIFGARTAGIPRFGGAPMAPPEAAAS